MLKIGGAAAVVLIVAAGIVFALTRPDATPPPERSITIEETTGGSLKGVLLSIPQGDKKWQGYAFSEVQILKQDTSEMIYEAQYDANGGSFEIPVTKIEPDTIYLVKVVSVDQAGNRSEGITDTLTTRLPGVSDLSVAFREDGVIIVSWDGSMKGGHIKITGPANVLFVDEDFAEGADSYSFSPAVLKTGDQYSVTVQNRGNNGLSAGTTISVTIPDLVVRHDLPSISGRADKPVRTFRGQIVNDGLIRGFEKFVIDYKYDAQSETDGLNQVVINLFDGTGGQVGETKTYRFTSTSSSGGPWYLGGWEAEKQRIETWDLAYDQLQRIREVRFSINAGDYAMAVDQVRYWFE